MIPMILSEMFAKLGLINKNVDKMKFANLLDQKVEVEHVFVKMDLSKMQIICAYCKVMFFPNL